MPRYPGAAWRPLPEAGREPIIRATQVIVHTAVSPAASLFGFFSRTDVDVESHFYVNQTGVEQYVDTDRQADANRHANARAISIETWDNGDPEHTPWTPRQLDMLVDLVAWCCRTHGIPPTRCTSPTSPGIGWHSMWGAPSDWTPVPGKTCPGGPRIAQMPDLIARVRAAVNEEDDPMAQFTEEDLIHAAQWAIRRELARGDDQTPRQAILELSTRGATAAIVAQAKTAFSEWRQELRVVAGLGASDQLEAKLDDLDRRLDVIAASLADPAPAG